MRRLLLITGGFPPAFSPRMGYFCRWLKQYTDWQIVALHEPVGKGGDHNAGFQHLVGYADREFLFPWEDRVHSPGRLMLKEFFGRRVGWRDVLCCFLGKLKFRFFKEGTCYGFRRALSAASACGPFDAILCSSTADRMHCYGDIARRKLNCPVVYDLRDIIEQSKSDQALQAWPWRRYLAIRRQVLRAGQHVIVTKREHGEALKQAGAVDSYELIHNGYDPDVFKPLCAVKSDTFDLVYIGSVYEHMSAPQLRLLFDALSAFVAKHRDENKIRVRFYSAPAVYQQSFLPRLDTVLRSVTSLEPACEQRELPKIFAAASVLLTVGHSAMNNLGGITTKIYEYLASNRPILEAIVNDDSDEEEILRRSQAGCVSGDVHEICDYLDRLYTEWRKHGFVRGTTDLAYVRQFSRAEQSQCICQILAEVCGARNR